MQDVLRNSGEVEPYIPDELKEFVLKIPARIQEAADINAIFRGIRVGSLPNENSGCRFTFQSRGIDESSVEEISTSLLGILEMTTAETVLIGDIAITEEVIGEIFESFNGIRVLEIMFPSAHVQQKKRALERELRAFLDEDPFIFHSMVTTSNVPVGYYGGTSGRNDSPTVHHKTRSAHLLAQGMDEKSTVAMRTNASDFALDGAFITGGKKGEIGLFSRKKGFYLPASDELKLILMAYMCSYSMPFANEAAEHDAYGHDEGLAEVAGRLEIPQIHRVAPDVLTSQNYLRWIGAYLTYRGGNFDPSEVPGFERSFLADEGLETTGVDRMHGGFDSEIVDVSTVTAAGIFEESVSALKVKGIASENARFLVTGAGKVTQGMLDWALNRRHETFEGSARLRPEQFTVVEPYDKPFAVIKKRFPGVQLFQDKGAGYIESEIGSDRVAVRDDGSKYDILISNALGKDLKPNHIQVLHNVGVKHLSGGANVKLEPKSMEQSEKLMRKLGMGTVSEYLVNAGGWLCCMGESLLREFYGGVVPQDPALAEAYNKYLIDAIVAMNDENLRRSYERAAKDGISVNAGSHREIADAVSSMHERYDKWSRALLYGDAQSKAEVLYELQLCVGAKPFLDRMISLGFPERPQGRVAKTVDEIRGELEATVVAE